MSEKNNMQFLNSSDLIKRATKVIPSAAQTYSKSYKYYCRGVMPAFMERGKGSHLWDVDDNEYIDYVMALGAITIGYSNKDINLSIVHQLENGMNFSQSSALEVELAEKLKEIIPCAEMVRFVKNGSDATTGAVRLARAFTGRDIILSFGYHGWHDWCIGISENDLGVPQAVKALTKEFKYNDLNMLERLFDENKNKIAAVIMEPVQFDMPEEDYLASVLELTHKNGALLIFDEIITGFRLSLSGAQGYFGVTPDLACFGKGMGNGASISAIVGKREVMRLIDEGAFISMTFGGETIPLASALATIKLLEKDGSFDHINKIGSILLNKTNEMIKEKHLHPFVKMVGIPCRSALVFESFNGTKPIDFHSIFQVEVAHKGILYLNGSHNFCLAHSERDIKRTLEVYDYAFKVIKHAVEMGSIKQLTPKNKIRPIFRRN